MATDRTQSDAEMDTTMSDSSKAMHRRNGKQEGDMAQKSTAPVDTDFDMHDVEER